METGVIREIDTTDIREAELRQALKKRKSGKAPGIDEIPTELYKADSDVAVKELTRLLNRIWHEEKVRDKWKKGLIVKLPKKGDRKECKKWRGVTLLPVDSKVMGRVMYDDFECSVLDEGEQTRWIKITTGVKEGCVMSGFLFFLLSTG